MNAATQNNTSVSDNLKARKAHLTALLKIIDTYPEKRTVIEKLTSNAIKSEMGLIEKKLKTRR